MKKIEPVPLMPVSSKSHIQIAAEMTDKVLEVVYGFGPNIPSVLAVGVLEICKQQVIHNQLEVLDDE